MRIQNGGWNVTNNKFKEPMSLIAWAMIDYACNHEVLTCFFVAFKFSVPCRFFFIWLVAPLGMSACILVGLSRVILNQFTLAEYLPPYTSAVNGQGKISGVSAIFDHLDSQTDTDTKPESYECCACSDGLGRSTSDATTSWPTTPQT
jgi:hypothetical protein